MSLAFVNTGPRPTARRRQGHTQICAQSPLDTRMLTQVLMPLVVHVSVQTSMDTHTQPRTHMDACPYSHRRTCGSLAFVTPGRSSARSPGLCPIPLPPLGLSAVPKGCQGHLRDTRRCTQNPRDMGLKVDLSQGPAGHLVGGARRVVCVLGLAAILSADTG